MKTVIVPFRNYLHTGIKGLRQIMKIIKTRSFSFSTQDEVGAYFMALDTIKRKLIYAKRTPETSSCLIIDLNHVEACKLTKEYASINAGELKTKKLYQFLKRIVLNVIFKNEAGFVSLQLFDAESEQQVNIEHLETQAKKWEGMVSKLLPIPIRERA